MNFNTERLKVRKLKQDDRDDFFDLMGNAKVMNAIPLQEMTQVESDLKMQEIFLLDESKVGKQIRVVTLKTNDELIGLCMLLTNSDHDTELGYRFREQFWGNGYATEVTKGMIDYGFKVLKLEKVTADSDKRNKASLRILSKLMTETREIIKKDAVDKRFQLLHKDWKN